MELIISASSVVVATKEVISGDLGTETMILQLKSGTYCGLNTIGSLVWNLIQQPVTIGYIRDEIVKEYDVDPSRCERDLLTLIKRMADEALLEISDGVAN